MASASSINCTLPSASSYCVLPSPWRSIPRRRVEPSQGCYWNDVRRSLRLIWSSRYRTIENSLGPNDKVEERDLRFIVVKRHYMGHMRFIGELYKGDLISIKIILFCLMVLLEGDTTGTKFALKLFIDDEHSVNCKTIAALSIGRHRLLPILCPILSTTSTFYSSSSYSSLSRLLGGTTTTTNTNTKTTTRGGGGVEHSAIIRRRDLSSDAADVIVHMRRS